MKLLFTITAIILLILTTLLTIARRENSGWIVHADELHRLFIITGDGRHQRQISPDNISAGDWAWSNDGYQITTYNTNNAAAEFWHLQPGGFGQMEFILPADYDVTSWSPDGARVVATKRSTPDPGTYTITAEGVIERHLSSRIWRPIWGAEWIYVLTPTQDGARLERYHFASGASEEVMVENRGIYEMAASQDGARVAMVIEGSLGTTMHIVEAESGDVTEIPADQLTERIFEPQWSSDGEWIAFFGGVTGLNLSLYRIQPDGSDRQLLTEDFGNMSELAWSPDGEWLLYTMSFDGDRDIFRVRADGSSHQRLTGAPFSEELPRYAPFAGRAWNPLWMILAAVGMIVASLAWRFRP